MLDEIKVPYINLNYFPVNSYSVTTLLPAEYTFSISCACDPQEAIMLARDTAYRNNHESPTLYNTLLVVKNECSGQWAFFIAPISKYSIEEKQIVNTWNQLKEKAGQELGISNYYQLYDSNYGQLPTLYPYPIDLDTTPLPSFQVELLLPQKYQYRPIKAKSPEEAVAFARYIFLWSENKRWPYQLCKFTSCSVCSDGFTNSSTSEINCRWLYNSFFSRHNQ